MPLLSFARTTREEPMSVRAAAEVVALDIGTKYPGTRVTIVAFGSSDDYADWVTVDVQAEKQSVSEERAEMFSKQLTRYGGIVLLTGLGQPAAPRRPRR